MDQLRISRLPHLRGGEEILKVLKVFVMNGKRTISPVGLGHVMTNLGETEGGSGWEWEWADWLSWHRLVTSRE